MSRLSTVSYVATVVEIDTAASDAARSGGVRAAEQDRPGYPLGCFTVTART